MNSACNFFHSGWKLISLYLLSTCPRCLQLSHGGALKFSKHILFHLNLKHLSLISIAWVPFSPFLPTTAAVTVPWAAPMTRLGSYVSTTSLLLTSVSRAVMLVFSILSRPAKIQLGLLPHAAVLMAILSLLP